MRGDGHSPWRSWVLQVLTNPSRHKIIMYMSLCTSLLSFLSYTVFHSGLWNFVASRLSFRCEFFCLRELNAFATDVVYVCDALRVIYMLRSNFMLRNKRLYVRMNFIIYNFRFRITRTIFKLREGNLHDIVPSDVINLESIGEGGRIQKDYLYRAITVIAI